MVVKANPTLFNWLRSEIKIGVICIVLFSFMVSYASAQNFTVRVTINNTDNRVFIPGVGERDSRDLGDITLYNPPHFYLASYLNNVLTGLVAAKGEYIRAYNSTANHTLEITQEIQRSRIFLVFSEGDYRNIDKNIGLIEQEDFLSQISPSFAYGLGVLSPIKVVLEYPDIDLVGGFSLRRGDYKLLINYQGVSGNKPVVGIRIV